MYYLQFLKRVVICSAKPYTSGRPGGFPLLFYVGAFLSICCAGFPAMSTAWGGPGADVAPVVDEPEGCRSNLGGTLWHYRRNPELIKEFHAYLEGQGLGPRDLLPTEALKPPTTMTRILIEPEKLTNLPRGAWSIEQWPGASGGGGLAAPDGGTNMYVPFWPVVPRAGTYRLWVRHYTFANSAGVIGIRIYPTGEEEPLPLLNVLANEWQVKQAGWRWSSYLVDLPAEPVELRVIHEYAEYQAPFPRRSTSRRLDCIYVTSECWREAPSLDELAAVRETGKSGSWRFYGGYPPQNQSERPGYEFRLGNPKAVLIQEVPFGQNEQDKQAWAWWMARPADWELRKSYPKLFEVSRRFWRQKVDQLSKVSHDPLPDYRELSRQIIFDDQWNLVGNPVMMAARKIERVKTSYPKKRGQNYIYHWLEAEEFEQVGQGWQRRSRSGNSRGCLRPVNDEVEATIFQRISLDRAGRYAIWVRTAILGDSYSPLRVQVTSNGVQLAAKDLLEHNYASDHRTDWTWQKIGVIKAKGADELQVKIQSVPRSAIDPKALPGKPALPGPEPKYFYRWIEAEQMETIAFDWDVSTRSGNSGDKCIGMGVDATGGVGYAAQEVAVHNVGEYYLWVRKGISGRQYSSLRIMMLSPDYGPSERRTERCKAYRRWIDDNQADIKQGTLVQRDLDRNDYEPDLPGQWTWQRVGPLKVNKPGNIRVEIWRRHYPYIYQKRALTDEILRQLGGHYFDSWVLTNNPDYQPKGIRKPTGEQALYLRPAVDVLLITDNLKYQPRLTHRPKLSLAEYLRRASSLGTKRTAGYVLWVDNPYGRWGQDDWPQVNPSQSGADRIRAVVARDMVWASSLRLRSLGDKPIRLEVSCDPMRGSNDQVIENKIEWRVAARIAPTWAPVPLLRRPYLIIPPYQTAAIWLTFDGKGLEPGTYRSSITLSSPDGMPRRSVPIEVKVADLSITPRRPILFGGYHGPYPGLVYKQDFKDHGVNISRIPYLSKAERQRWGYRMVNYASGEFGPKRDKELRAAHRRTLGRMRTEQVGFNEALWKIGDEAGAGNTFPYDGKVAKEMDPRIQVLYNPGGRAGLYDFQVLDPYTSIWEPYVKHLRFPKRVAIFSVKPYLFYTIHSGDESSVGMPESVYEQIRGVPARPGNCIGTRIYTIKAAIRDAWDTAYQVLPSDEGVFMYPSRYGPVPTRGWEAIRDAGQHANLARMLKEKAAELGLADRYADLVAEGSLEQLITADHPKNPIQQDR